MRDKNEETPLPTTLFHYCSLETLLNIISKKTIRLSEITKSNDYMETKWLFEFLEEEIIEQYRKNPFINGELIYGLNEIETLRFVVNTLKKKILHRTSDLFYVSCFSENEDILSQWRGYADDGHGVAIGFNTDALKNLLIKEESINLVKVIYPDNKCIISKEIKEYAELVLESIIYAFSSRDVSKIFSENFSTIDLMHELSSRVLIQNSIRYKNPAFKEEAEWRIVFDDEIDKFSEWENWYDQSKEKSSLDGDIAKIFPNGLQFKAQKNKIVSYFDLSFKGHEPYIINKITIGPKSDVKEEDLYHLLRYYGYEADEILIEKSVSTYK